VHDKNGTPASAAAVIAFPADRRLWKNFGLTPSWIRQSIASTDGTFRLSSVREGSYFLIAVDPPSAGKWRDPDFLAAARASAQEITLKKGESKIVELSLASVSR
jgi:hypothetical protein